MPNVPPSPPNGGLFSGVPRSSEWANVPVEPTEAAFNRMFRLHNPGVPAEVEFHLVGGHRPGNNHLQAGAFVLMPTNQLFIPDSKVDFRWKWWQRNSENRSPQYGAERGDPCEGPRRRSYP